MDDPAELPPSGIDTTIKSTVVHKFRFAGPSVALSLLRDCVLSGFPDDFSANDIVRTQTLQRRLRHHYYRTITANPEQRYRLTYCLNCPPPAFQVSPKTRTCNNPRICPWCYVRRQLIPMVTAIMEVPKAVRQDCQLVAWRRVVPYSTQVLPFFRRDRGPHVWCQSLVTAQLAVPSLAPKTQQLCLYHIGIQLVPKAVQPVQLLSQYRVIPPLTVLQLDAAHTKTVTQLLGVVARLPWVTLAHKDQLPQFQALMVSGHKQQLLRINRYKPQGASHGNHQPTVPASELQSTPPVPESL